MILLPQASHFGTKIQSKTHAIFAIAFWCHFFRFFCELGAKSAILGPLLAPSWAQNDTQNRPSGAKIASFSQTRAGRFACGSPLAPFWLPFGSLRRLRHHFSWFWTDFGSIFLDFGHIFYDFCNVFRNDFCSSQNGERPQRTSKNCQKPAETSTTKSHCIHWPFCKTPAATTNACTKTPID